MDSTIIVALIGVVSTFITYFLTKRKYNAEVSSKEIENMSSSFDLYKKMTNETITAQNKKIELLQRENSELKEQVNHLQLQIASLLDAICYDTTCKLRRANFPMNKEDK